MKIQTFKISQYGRKRMFSNFGVVEFDKEGVAEVKDEVGEFIIKNFPKIVKFGDKPLEDKLPENKVISGNVSELKEQITEFQNTVAKRDISIKRLKSEVGLGKEELDVYKALVNDLKREIEILSAANKLTTKKSDDLVAKMESRTKAELFNICSEMDYPKGEWKDLNKGKLIEYLISKNEN